MKAFGRSKIALKEESDEKKKLFILLTDGVEKEV